MQYEDLHEWFPVDYDPGLSVENWLMLLQDETVFTPSSMDVINCLRDCGGTATCVELSRKFGRAPNYYNTNAWQLAKRIYKRTGCPLCEEKDCKYWPILFVGRHVGRQRFGTYEWKLRDELRDALGTLDYNARCREAKSMSLPQLEEAAKLCENKHPQVHEVSIKQIYRNPYIREYAIRRANGFCQLCGMRAPFCDLEGNPFLEFHHVIWLSQGGEDTIQNTVALCPNCHRKMHILQDPADVEILRRTAGSLEK